MTDICSICHEAYENPKLLHCRHTFCCKCIDGLIGSSNTPCVFKCPLCRSIMKVGRRGVDELLDNYYVSSTLSTMISSCGGCGKICKIKACKQCHVNLCSYCKTSHMKLENCSKLRKSDYSFVANTEVENKQLIKSTRTKYLFNLEGIIAIPKFRHGIIDVNLSLVHCFNDLLLTAPNGEMVAVFENENGEELLRNKTSSVNITGITSGTDGCPLMIRNGLNEVYEYSYGSLTALFSTASILPKAIARLNDGKIVIVGIRSLHGKDERRDKTEAAFCIYEYDGTIAHEMSKEEKENVLGYPTSICVNTTNNEFYIGDTKKKEVMSFRENGTYVSSYKTNKLLEPDSRSDIAFTSKQVENCDIFPMSLAYSHINDLLFASFATEEERGIWVFSPSLDLLGLFTSATDLGIPAGISCDGKDKLYVGDGQAGIIREFSLTKFINELQDLYNSLSVE